MHRRLEARLASFRLGILAALGLAPLACGPGGSTSADDGGSGSSSAADTTADTSAGSATSGGPTSGPTTTAGSAEATGTGSSAEATEATMSPTSAGPTATSVDTGASESGDTGALVCGLKDCVDPQPILQTGSESPSGLVRCASGLIHRVEAVACVAPQAKTDCTEPLEGSSCVADEDCTEHAFGTCMEGIVCGFTAGVCGCVYGCETDADCGVGEVCLCAADGVSARSRCVAAGCVTDDDCGGAACAASTDAIDAPEVAGFACHADGDACCDDADCDVGAQCRFGVIEPGAWACDFGADCGRPLRIDGVAETAAPVRRGDWQAPALVRVPAERAALAGHWTRMGLAEHASVGSFARFILQLLAVGAPASLVAAAQQALADEVEHARVCFALAGAYGGAEVGPGPLPAGCAALATGLEEVVRAVIVEACVGETLSALEVEEAAVRAEDPAVRRLLQRVAADEARHAALGWEFLQWALAQDAGLRARAAEWFAAAIAGAEARVAAWDGDASLRRHGVVDAGLRAVVVQGGLTEVVRPCSAALLRAA